MASELSEGRRTHGRRQAQAGADGRTDEAYRGPALSSAGARGGVAARCARGAPGQRDAASEDAALPLGVVGSGPLARAWVVWVVWPVSAQGRAGGRGRHNVASKIDEAPSPPRRQSLPAHQAVSSGGARWPMAGPLARRSCLAPRPDFENGAELGAREYRDYFLGLVPPAQPSSPLAFLHLIPSPLTRPSFTLSTPSPTHSLSCPAGLRVLYFLIVCVLLAWSAIAPALPPSLRLFSSAKHQDTTSSTRQPRRHERPTCRRAACCACDRYHLDAPGPASGHAHPAEPAHACCSGRPQRPARLPVAELRRALPVR